MVVVSLWLLLPLLEPGRHLSPVVHCPSGYLFEIPYGMRNGHRLKTLLLTQVPLSTLQNQRIIKVAKDLQDHLVQPQQNQMIGSRAKAKAKCSQ